MHAATAKICIETIQMMKRIQADRNFDAAT